MKYAFIQANQRSYGVRTMCRMLQVSPSGYYAARSRPASACSRRRVLLTSRIREVHVASRQTYGAPRVHAELRAQGVACCRNTVAKLMHQAQIMPRAIRRFRVTTDSRMTKASPNLVGRVFEIQQHRPADQGRRQCDAASLPCFRSIWRRTAPWRAPRRTGARRAPGHPIRCARWRRSRRRKHGSRRCRWQAG